MLNIISKINKNNGISDSQKNISFFERINEMLKISVARNSTKDKAKKTNP